MLRSVIIIPARYKSSRLPGKPLIEILGKSMIRRTWEQCVKAFPKESIFVATEDDRVFSHCEEFGINVLKTSDKCLTGTDRVAEVAKLIDADYYINVQGDEPLFNPDDISKIVNLLEENSGSILNGYCKIDHNEDFKSVSIPKVVFKPNGKLLYMSRAPIPNNKENSLVIAYRQVCIYAFPKEALLKFAQHQAKTPLEAIEDIEILRFLEMNMEVQMVELSTSSIAIDTPEDVERILKVLNNEKNN